MKLIEIALDAGDQLDRVYGRGIAGNVDKAADTLNPGFHHRDRRAWLRRELRPGHARDRGRRSRYLGRRRRGHIEWPWIENRRDVSGSNADQRRQGDTQVHPAPPGDCGGYFHNHLTIAAAEDWNSRRRVWGVPEPAVAAYPGAATARPSWFAAAFPRPSRQGQTRFPRVSASRRPAHGRPKPTRWTPRPRPSPGCFGPCTSSAPRLA